MHFSIKWRHLFKHTRCLYHHGDANPAQLYFVKFITENWWLYNKRKMKEYAFKCVLSLKNNIRIVAENVNSFKHWAWELATFEVPRYPMNDVINRQCGNRKKRLKSSEFLLRRRCNI